MKIYKVGGAVRDKLLGLYPTDTDWVVVGGTELEMERLGFTPVGKFFPVYLHPVTKEEYALARRERKVTKGYTGFSCDVQDATLEDDLARRDLTINAIAEDPDTGELIDPYGGQRDLANRVLQHVSPAFSEDPLRVLRVARFVAKLGFDVDPSTLTLCAELLKSGEVDLISLERINDEMCQIYNAKYYQRGLSFLRTIGACDSRSLKPYVAPVETNPLNWETARMVVRLAVAGNFIHHSQLATYKFDKDTIRMWSLCKLLIGFYDDEFGVITPGRLVDMCNKIPRQLWNDPEIVQHLRDHLPVSPKLLDLVDTYMVNFHMVDMEHYLKGIPKQMVAAKIVELKMDAAEAAIGKIVVE